MSASFSAKKRFGDSYWVVSVFYPLFPIIWVLPFKMILKSSSKKATSDFCIFLFGFGLDCFASSQVCCL